MRIIFCLLLFFLLHSSLFANREEFRQEYNQALALIKKYSYTQGISILENLLIYPEFEKNKDYQEIRFRALLSFARVYGEVAFLELKKEQKNIPAIRIYFQQAIRIYQQILEENLILEGSLENILSISKQNLMLFKLQLYQLKTEEEQKELALFGEKDIPTIIQELKKEEKKISQEIAKLEQELINYNTQEKINLLLKKKLLIQKKFLVLEKKIQQRSTIQS